MLAEFDPRFLGKAQIGTLTDHLCANLVGVDAQAVIGFVADFPVLFMGGFDIGADAAEPEQFGLGLQQRGDQLGRAHRFGLDAGQSLDFRCQRDRLGGSRENPATL